MEPDVRDVTFLLRRESYFRVRLELETDSNLKVARQ